jgi:hypothetical protein
VIVNDEKVKRERNILINVRGCNIDLNADVNHQTSPETAPQADEDNVPRLLIVHSR